MSNLGLLIDGGVVHHDCLGNRCVLVHHDQSVIGGMLSLVVDSHGVDSHVLGNHGVDSHGGVVDSLRLRL